MNLRPSQSQLIAGLSPLPREKRLSDRVTDVVLEMIYGSGLEPGNPLPSERQLAESLGVARGVVREAVRDLAARGIVSVQPGLGITVAHPDPAGASDALSHLVRVSPDVDFDGVQEVRRALEVDMARHAATRATDEGIVRLRAAHERQIEAGHDLERAALADMDFHRVIAQLTGNPLFLIVLDSMKGPLMEIRRMAMSLSGQFESGIAEHRRILEAIAAHDPELARREMDIHFEASRRDYHDSSRSASPGSVLALTRAEAG